MSDPKYLNIPNICFSLTDADDKRESKFSNHRIERGFDDSETWSLRDSIADFIVPRLEVFINLTAGYPIEFNSLDEWKIVLNKILWSFKSTKSMDTGEDELYPWDKFEEGMNLFNKYYINLWW